jgi:hypothetical protein
MTNQRLLSGPAGLGLFQHFSPAESGPVEKIAHQRHFLMSQESEYLPERE